MVSRQPSPGKLMTMARFIARNQLKSKLRANGLRTLDIEPATLRMAVRAILEAERDRLKIGDSTC
jgi:hypothetical protein